MLSKLIKYEWKALFKPNLIIFITLLSTTLIASLVLIISASTDTYSSFAILPILFFYYLLLIAVPVASLIIFAMRFYKSCYGNEGYLTNTLPVNSSKIVFSKLLTGFIYSFSMTILVILSLATVITSFLAFSKNLPMDEILFNMSTLPSFKEITNISIPLFLFIMILSLIISSFASISMVIGSISFGNLWQKHKILGSIVSYVGIYFVMQFLSFIFVFPATTKLSLAMMDNSDPFLFMHGYTKLLLIFVPSVSLFVTIALSIISVFLLKKKINLD